MGFESTKNYIHILIFVLGSAPSLSWTKELKARSFLIQDLKVRFIYEANEGLLLSEDCFSEAPPRCNAYQKTKEASKAFRMDVQLKGGANPGSLFCKKLGGAVEWGYDALRNQVGFCQFDDDSLISLGSIVSLIR